MAKDKNKIKYNGVEYNLSNNLDWISMPQELFDKLIKEKIVKIFPKHLPGSIEALPEYVAKKFFEFKSNNTVAFDNNIKHLVRVDIVSEVILYTNNDFLCVELCLGERGRMISCSFNTVEEAEEEYQRIQDILCSCKVLVKESSDTPGSTTEAPDD